MGAPFIGEKKSDNYQIAFLRKNIINSQVFPIAFASKLTVNEEGNVVER